MAKVWQVGESSGDWATDTRMRLFGATLHVRMPPFDELTRHYVELYGRSKNLEPVFERFGTYFVEGSLMRNFEAEGRPAKWPALSPMYAERKAKVWPGRKILVASGAMKAGFTFEATPKTLKITNVNRWWWIVHQKGTENLFGRGIHLPARPMLVMQNVDKGVFTRWVRKFVTTGEV